MSQWALLRVICPTLAHGVEALENMNVLSGIGNLEPKFLMYMDVKYVINIDSILVHLPWPKECSKQQSKKKISCQSIVLVGAHESDNKFPLKSKSNWHNR